MPLGTARHRGGPHILRPMGKVRAIPAPHQDDSRIIVLGVVLWPDHLTLHAVVESDAEEIADGLQEEEQFDMFQVIDDVGGTYRSNGAGGTSELHVQEHRVRLRPGVPADATKITVTIWVRHQIYGSLEIPL
jgi:hypothetical protein